MQFQGWTGKACSYKISAFYPDGLRNFVDIFARKFQNFPILKKNPNTASQKTSLTKI
jgi:hypothetical protein